MAYTSFRDCMDGTNVVDEWLRQQPAALRTKFYSMFKNLSVTEVVKWSLPQTKMLTGQFRVLREFRVRIRRVRYRLVGFHGPRQGQVTLCSGLSHSENSAAQRAAMSRALRLRERVLEGEATTVEHIP